MLKQLLNDAQQWLEMSAFDDVEKSEYKILSADNV